MSYNDSITYRRICDYRISNLTLPPEEAKIMFVKCGMMH